MDRNEIQKMLIKLNPGLEESLRKNEAKRNLALELWAIRKKAGLSQDDVAERAGLTVQDIERIEELTGVLPSENDVAQYKAACL